MSGTETLKALSASSVASKGQPHCQLQEALLENEEVWDLMSSDSRLTTATGEPRIFQGGPVYLMGGDRYCCHHQALGGCPQVAWLTPLASVRWTHLDTRAPSWWSVSGLAESQGCNEGVPGWEALRRTGAVGIPLAHWNPLVEGGKEEQQV